MAIAQISSQKVSLPLHVVITQISSRKISLALNVVIAQISSRKVSLALHVVIAQISLKISLALHVVIAQISSRKILPPPSVSGCSLSPATQVWDEAAGRVWQKTAADGVSVMANSLLFVQRKYSNQPLPHASP